MRRWFFGIFLLLLTTFSWGQSNKIPAKAFLHKDTIAAELDRLFPSLKERNYIPALIEHESCISLTHSRCWSSTSRLKSAREEGAGLGQITKAWSANGTLRFDSLTDMRTRYKNELAEASWDTIYQRPDIQIRIIVLMVRDNWNRLYDVQDPFERLSMVDAAYNGGLGGLNKERRVCGLAAGCDPNKWFGHVEKYCQKSKKILYGNRSACDINRNHVNLTMKKILPKYKQHYQL